MAFTVVIESHLLKQLYWSFSESFKKNYGGEWIYIYMAESLHCSPNTVNHNIVNRLYPNT